MTALSLEISKKIYELVGEYETENRWARSFDLDVTQSSEVLYPQGLFPAPTFAELIRVLPKIGEKNGWSDLGEGETERACAKILAVMYMSSPSEEGGMEAVEKYLKTIL